MVGLHFCFSENKTSLICSLYNLKLNNNVFSGTKIHFLLKYISFYKLWLVIVDNELLQLVANG